MSPTHYLMLGALLFVIGFAVVIVRKHPLVVMLGLALMLQAVNLALAALATWFQDWSGAVGVLVVMTVAAVEFATGLGAALVCSRQRQMSVRVPQGQDETC